MKLDSHRPPASFIDLMMDAVFAVNVDAGIVFVSAACERIFGYSPEEMIGKNMFDMMLPEDRERTRDSVADIMFGNPQFHFENRYIRKDGGVVHIMWTTRWSPLDQLRIGVARDITERKKAELLQSTLYSIAEAAYVADDLPTLFQRIHEAIETVLPVNNFAVGLYNGDTDQLSFPYHVDQYQQTPEPFKLIPGMPHTEVIHTGQPLLLTSEKAANRLAGPHFPVGSNPLCWLGVPLKTPQDTKGLLVVKSYSGGACYSQKDQELLHFVSAQIATAIERQQMQIRLKHMAQYDQLTALPNRGFLYDRLKLALSAAQREQGQLSVLYIDLDKFKQVNDTLGHGVGDLLLQDVAKRLLLCVRESDTVARFGGDEFVVLLPRIRLPEHASLVAKKIRDALEQSFNLDGHSLNIVPSIGIAVYPEHGHDETELLKHADKAMYAQKNADTVWQMS